MKIKIEIGSLEVRQSSATEYVTATGREVGDDATLMQYVDYSLSAEEVPMKARLMPGTVIECTVRTIGEPYEGRPRFKGKITNVAPGKK